MLFRDLIIKYNKLYINKTITKCKKFIYVLYINYELIN